MARLQSVPVLWTPTAARACLATGLEPLALAVKLGQLLWRHALQSKQLMELDGVELVEAPVTERVRHGVRDWDRHAVNVLVDTCCAELAPRAYALWVKV
jgi:hypothetical protein